LEVSASSSQGTQVADVRLSRTPSFTSCRSIRDRSDDAENFLIDREQRPILDVHIERGFDVPLITLSHHAETSGYASSRNSQASTEISENVLVGDDLESTSSPQENVILGTPAFQQSPTKRPCRQRKSLRKGWRAGVVAATLMTVAVVIINFTLTTWASLHFGLDNGIGDAFTGDCGTVNMWSTGLHVLINGLSSALLSASNYTMQCLTAPTREECDAAHARGDWLDIGVPSVRNLSRIRRSRRIAWALLMLSSIPVHFLYNSAVFKQLDNNTNTYRRVFVFSQFLDSRDADFTVFPEPISATGELIYKGNRIVYMVPWYNLPIVSQLHAVYQRDPLSFDRFEPPECVELYDRSILTGHSHLLVILNQTIDRDAEDVGSSSEAMFWPTWTDLNLSKAIAAATPQFW
jgi:hypothetical protein